MQLRLHANATTTPRTRAYVQNSTASPAALARELGIHPRTVARWKTRPDVADRSTCPHRLATAISQWEEALIVELRRGLARALAIEGVAVERAGDKIAAADLFLRAGRSAAAQGDKTSARDWLRRAMSLAPDRPVGRDAADALRGIDKSLRGIDKSDQ